MKNIIKYIVLSCFLLFSSTFVYSQERQGKYIGIKAGVSISKLQRENIGDFDNYRRDFTAGIIVKSRPLIHNISLSAELNYIQKKYTIGITKETPKGTSEKFIGYSKDILSYHYVNMPFAILYTFDFTLNYFLLKTIRGIYGESGIEPSIFLKETKKHEGNLYFTTTYQPSIKKYVWGYFIGCGVITNLLKRENSVDFRYYRGFNGIFENHKDSNFYTYLITLTLFLR